MPRCVIMVFGMRQNQIIRRIASRVHSQAYSFNIALRATKRAVYQSVYVKRYGVIPQPHSEAFTLQRITDSHLLTARQCPDMEVHEVIIRTPEVIIRTPGKCYAA